jgi:hypothetical protein
MWKPAMPKSPTIIDAVGDPDLFAGWFKNSATRRGEHSAGPIPRARLDHVPHSIRR